MSEQPYRVPRGPAAAPASADLSAPGSTELLGPRQRTVEVAD